MKDRQLDLLAQNAELINARGLNIWTFDTDLRPMLRGFARDVIAAALAEDLSIDPRERLDRLALPRA